MDDIEENQVRSEEDDADPNCEDETVLSEEEPVNMSRFEENHSDFTLSESTLHAHNYESNPHFNFSAEESLCTQRLEEGYDLPDPNSKAWLNIHHPSVLPSLDQQLNPQLTFSAEEDILYARRFEEGYDLPDPKYEAWLNIHHASVLPSPDKDLNSQLTFSTEDNILYARRFEEGYDLPDPKYEAWLNIHHPSVLPSLDQQLNLQLTFSTEEEILYARRFEEGYDLTDPKYGAWLSIHHPIAASVISNKTLTTGFHVSSNVTSLHVNPAASESSCTVALLIVTKLVMKASNSP